MNVAVWTHRIANCTVLGQLAQICYRFKMGCRIAIRATLAALVPLAGSWPFHHAQAQTAVNGPSSQFAPLEPPILDPDLLKLPSPAHDDSAGKFKVDRSDKAATGFTVPNRVDLGKYELEFKAGHSSDLYPRTGLDSGETANLSKVAPRQKSESALPNYFGLKLRAPTQ